MDNEFTWQFPLKLEFIMNNRMPHATRPYRNEILALAELVQDDNYLEMTEGEFVGKLFKATKGCINPNQAVIQYLRLMGDAGLEPLRTKKD